MVNDHHHEIILDDDWRDEALAIASAERVAPLELVRRRVEANHETAALRRDLKRFAALLRERVEKKTGDWLNVDDVGRLLGLSRKAVYCELMRNPSGQLAQASSRLGRRLRWSRAGIDELLLRKRPRSVLLARRVPSPVSKKGD